MYLVIRENVKTGQFYIRKFEELNLCIEYCCLRNDYNYCIVDYDSMKIVSYLKKEDY